MIRLSGPVRGIKSILIISGVEWCCLQGGRVLVVGVSKRLKNKLMRQQTRCSIKWSGDLIQGYVCDFRRRVIRVWGQTACRANSQSCKHYPWKPTCLWRDATNRLTSNRHYVSVTWPSGYTERCCCCTCCRKRGRWRPEYLERLDIIQYFPLRTANF